MKWLILNICFLFASLHNLKAQKVEKRDAADALNFIDNLTNPLKPSANNLTAYFHKLESISNAGNDYRLSDVQIASLRSYYDNLIAVYDKAIKKATKNKTIDKFEGLKDNFLKLLKEGRKPWATIIPIYLKMFKKGKTLLSISEQNIISKSGSLFISSADKALNWAKLVAIQEDEIEKQYHLELIKDLYQ